MSDYSDNEMNKKESVSLSNDVDSSEKDGFSESGKELELSRIELSENTQEDVSEVEVSMASDLQQNSAGSSVNENAAEVIKDATLKKKFPKAISKKRKTIICLALVAIVAIAAFVISAPNRQKAKIASQIKDTKEYTVSGLKCNMPSQWEETDFVYMEGLGKEHKTVSLVKNGKVTNVEEIAYIGEVLDGAPENIPSGISDNEIINKETGSNTIKGASGKYELYELNNDNTLFLSTIKDDDSIFEFYYLAPTKTFDISQPQTLLENIDFESYKSVAIESIEAKYEGSTEAETKLSESEIQGLVVNATFEDGNKKDIAKACSINGPSKLEPGKTATLNISYTDWNNKDFTSKVEIKCTSVVKELSAEYSGKRDGGTEIKNNSITVNAKLDNGKTITVNDFELKGPSKLKAGAENNYTITYAGVSTNLTIMGKRGFEQVAADVEKEVMQSKYASNELFTTFKVEYDWSSEENMGYFTIMTNLERGSYNYLSIAQTGSEAALTWEYILLDMCNYCSDLKDEFTKEGFDSSVAFYVWAPGKWKGERAFSYVDDERIQLNPYAN